MKPGTVYEEMGWPREACGLRRVVYGVDGERSCSATCFIRLAAKMTLELLWGGRREPPGRWHERVYLRKNHLNVQVIQDGGRFVL